MGTTVKAIGNNTLHKLYFFPNTEIVNQIKPYEHNSTSEKSVIFQQRRSCYFSNQQFISVIADLEQMLN